jgi:hypothetical protein
VSWFVECLNCEKHIYPQRTKLQARQAWNSSNSDRYNQQFVTRIDVFTDWDGVVEHLPPKGTMLTIQQNGNMYTGELGIGISTTSNNTTRKVAMIYLTNTNSIVELSKGMLFSLAEVD